MAPAPRSALPEAQWPAIPTPSGAALLAMQYQFQETERWTPEAILTAQWRQIAHVLRHALATVPYYRDRQRDYALDETRMGTGDAWARLPILTRSDIQTAGAALLSERLPDGHGKIHALSTSGSTGAPVTIRGTEVTQFYWGALTLRHYLWHCFDLSRTIASIRHASGKAGKYPEGSAYPGWGPAIASAFDTGPSLFLSIATPIADQIEWLARVKADYLITYPTNLVALLNHCRGAKVPFPVQGGVQTLSEVLTPEARALCRDMTGLPILDMYSSQEAGYIALQCPDREHYHVQSENLLVEVLDSTGQPCAPGQTGRVVVTPLHNFAMPLIRYWIGDYATAGAPCACGRGLPVLTRIMGRARNMLTLPSGHQIWPYFGGEKLPSLAPIRQYQLAQVSRTDLELRVVADRALTADEIARVRDSINRCLGTPYTIALSYRDAIARSPGGKFEDFRSELSS